VQRATNGPTAVEVLAGNLGLPLTPSLLGGSNYAVFGAETGFGNFLAVSTTVPPIINNIFSNPPATGVAAQVQSFVGGGGTFTQSSLVVLWAGANDLFTEVTLANTLPGSFIFPALTNLSNEVSDLYYLAGARTILMPNMPDIGLTPFGLTSGNSAGLSALSGAFNLGLHDTIGQLEFGLPGLNIIEFDTPAAFGKLLANADALGFTHTTDPCLNLVTLIPCANPNEYIFWDAAHPTARVHQILGDLFFTAVPEPGALALFSLALATAGFCRRRNLS
jgi:phospholipase/lecithinase/hemolysin